MKIHLSILIIALAHVLTPSAFAEFSPWLLPTVQRSGNASSHAADGFFGGDGPSPSFASDSVGLLAPSTLSSSTSTGGSSASVSYDYSSVASFSSTDLFLSVDVTNAVYSATRAPVGDALFAAESSVIYQFHSDTPFLWSISASLQPAFDLNVYGYISLSNSSNQIFSWFDTLGVNSGTDGGMLPAGDSAVTGNIGTGGQAPLNGTTIAGTFSGSYSFSASAVPEPSTGLLLAGAGLGLLLRRRRAN